MKKILLSLLCLSLFLACKTKKGHRSRSGAGKRLQANSQYLDEAMQYALKGSIGVPSEVAQQNAKELYEHIEILLDQEGEYKDEINHNRTLTNRKPFDYDLSENDLNDGKILSLEDCKTQLDLGSYCFQEYLSRFAWSVHMDSSYLQTRILEHFPPIGKLELIQGEIYKDIYYLLAYSSLDSYVGEPKQPGETLSALVFHVPAYTDGEMEGAPELIRAVRLGENWVNYEPYPEEKEGEVNNLPAELASYLAAHDSTPARQGREIHYFPSQHLDYVIRESYPGKFKVIISGVDQKDIYPEPVDMTYDDIRVFPEGETEGGFYFRLWGHKN